MKSHLSIHLAYRFTQYKLTYCLNNNLKFGKAGNFQPQDKRFIKLILLLFI